jgi:uncharacterized membrane protein YqjE
MTMPTSESPGVISSLRVLGESLAAGLRDRVELLSVELQEEKFRLIQLTLWFIAAAFTGMLAITFASITLVYLFWESARLAVLGGLTLFYTGALIAIIITLRRFISSQPTPFEATRRELEEDIACIRKPS